IRAPQGLPLEWKGFLAHGFAAPASASATAAPRPSHDRAAAPAAAATTTTTAAVTVPAAAATAAPTPGATVVEPSMKRLSRRLSQDVYETT
ncbi:hypothetical protein KEM52_001866, partial [Ascosphaera acerosa]